jgi:hypothetical protein
MRDHTSGPEWDKRNLGELSYCRVRVVCKFCRHVAYFRPEQLTRFQPPRWHWQLVIPRFRCTVCGEREADAFAEPLPRN